MTLTLREDDFEAFFQVPFNVYDGTPYVSPLKSDLKRFVSAAANPLFDSSDQITLYTAHRDGRPIGRLTAHIHAASNALHDQKAAYFGYFDCANDPEAATLLLKAAEGWARARGLTSLTGNFNLTAMQMIGVQTGGFEAQVFSDCMWSPPHAALQLKANGFSQIFPMSTYETDLPTWHTHAGPERHPPEGVTFAPITRQTLSARLEEARQILNISFADNPMFVPVSKEEYDFQAKDLKWVMDKRLSAVLHHEGQAIGALICIPDLNPPLKRMKSRLGPLAPWHYLRHRMTNDRAVVIYYGVRPDWRGKGLTPLMIDRISRAALKAGYKTVGGTWIADVNEASLRQPEKIGATRLQRLHLFRKAL
ncbi:GNAT family N-acetyltransferase [Aestuariibius insulae]|uniref:GNAT family N-acetyltransferase n=1 Tax=Aestuariibius insulae TaxID=2058287 RepID=UPI00345ECC61